MDKNEAARRMRHALPQLLETESKLFSRKPLDHIALSSQRIASATGVPKKQVRTLMSDVFGYIFSGRGGQWFLESGYTVESVSKELQLEVLSSKATREHGAIVDGCRHGKLTGDRRNAMVFHIGRGLHKRIR